MNKYGRYIYIILAALFCSLVLSINVFATEEHSSEENLAGFNYSVNFPENQMDSGVGYFRLKMEPGKKQVVSISLSNPKAVPVKININLSGAKTNNNGVIEYGENNFVNDKSLKHDFVDVVTAPKSVELAPKENKDLEIAIDMPQEEYEGIIVGGVQMMVADSPEDKEKNKGTTVVNRYAYIVPIVLQESDNLPIPDLKLNKVYPEHTNGRNSIFVNISNIVAEYLNDISMEVRIKKKGSSEVLYESKSTSMRMAPNTVLNYPISLNGEKMKSGEYSAEILVKSNEQKWEWSKNFKISQQEADKFNARDVELVQDKGVDLKVVFPIVLISMVVIILTIIFIRKSRKKKVMRKKKKGSIK